MLAAFFSGWGARQWIGLAVELALFAWLVRFLLRLGKDESDTNEPPL